MNCPICGRNQFADYILPDGKTKFRACTTCVHRLGVVYRPETEADRKILDDFARDSYAPSFPPCTLPLIEKFPGVTAVEVECVPRHLAAMIASDIAVTSQAALAVGLCNCLSLCLDSMVHRANTDAENQALLTIEEHLEHTVNVLGHIRRNGKNYD